LLAAKVFPYGTLAINVLGTFLMGTVSEYGATFTITAAPEAKSPP
jgi:fluoride ion exporter CrcB/FEX